MFCFCFRWTVLITTVQRNRTNPSFLVSTLRFISDFPVKNNLCPRISFFQGGGYDSVQAGYVFSRVRGYVEPET